MHLFVCVYLYVSSLDPLISLNLNAILIFSGSDMFAQAQIDAKRYTKNGALF